MIYQVKEAVAEVKEHNNSVEARLKSSVLLAKITFFVLFGWQFGRTLSGCNAPDCY